MTRPKKLTETASIFSPKNKVTQKKAESPKANSQESHEDRSNMDIRFDQLIATIKEGNIKLSEKIDQLEEKLCLVHADHKALAVRVKSQEQITQELEDRVAKIEVEKGEMKEALNKCQEEMERQEMRSRRYNIKITGVKELSEKDTKMEVLVENILKNILPGLDESGPLDIDLAHRIPLKPPQPGREPRAIIVKCSRIESRNRIMELNKSTGEKMFQGNQVRIFQDQTRRVQQLRLNYWQVKKKLRDYRIQYSMIKEATLRIVHRDQIHLFNTPEEAMEYIDKLPSE